MAAERKAEGRRASATMRRIGAEKRSRDINIVMRKNRVLIHRGIASAALLKGFSSLGNPISLLAGSQCVVGCDGERERERVKGGMREKVSGRREMGRNGRRVGRFD